MKLAKLVNNINNWATLSRSAQTGMYVHVSEGNKKSYYFGLEEWNNNEIMLKHKIAYLDCFRSFPRKEFYEEIELIKFLHKNLYHVGRFQNVRTIKSDEIPEIKKTLSDENWLINIENSFHKINDLRPINANSQYVKCWNSEKIVAPINEGFIVNIRYDKLTFFEQPINLTLLNNEVNKKWRRLIHLYGIPTEFENLFQINTEKN